MTTKPQSHCKSGNLVGMGKLNVLMLSRFLIPPAGKALSGMSCGYLLCERGNTRQERCFCNPPHPDRLALLRRHKTPHHRFQKLLTTTTYAQTNLA